MRRILRWVLLALTATMIIATVSLSWPPPAPPLLGRDGVFAIEHVNVVDVVAGELLPDVTVVIEAGRVRSMLPSAAATVPPEAARIDGRGKYLLPGLWDMHTHSIKLSPQLHHALYVAHGVTAVRDMSGCLSRDDSYWACATDRRQWSGEVERGARVAPRYPLQSSYQTNGGNEVPEGFAPFFRLRSREDAQRLGAFARDAGLDFIKTYNELTPEQYGWLAELSASGGPALAGHLPLRVDLPTALAAGQRSIEHGRLFLFECFAGIDAFRALADPIAHYNAGFRLRLLNEQNEDACQRQMRAMAASTTWWVPTLTTLHMSAVAAQPEARNDPRLDFVPAVQRHLLWFPDANRAAREPAAPDGGNVHRRLFELASLQVARAHAAGVKLLAGTDTTDTFVYPGASLHDELRMLVEAGLSPADALRTATVSAATFAGQLRDHGSIAPGKVADLLLLAGNPLADIRNTLGIEAVFLAGRRYDAAALGQLLQFARDQAGSWRVNLRLVWDMLASPLMRVQLAD